MKKKAILFALSASNEDLIESLTHCSKNEIEPTVVVPTYSFELQLPPDFSHVCVLYPMDILKIEDIDQAFQDSFQWMRDFSQIDVDGEKVADMTISKTKSPKMWAWTHLLPPHLFLHFRFVKLIHEAFKSQSFDFHSISGEHTSFPWKKVFLKQVARSQKIPPLPVIQNNKAGTATTSQWIESAIPAAFAKSLNESKAASLMTYFKVRRQSLYGHRYESSKKVLRSLTRKTRLIRKLDRLDKLENIIKDPVMAWHYTKRGVNDIFFDIRIVALGSWGRFRAKKKLAKEDAKKRNPKSRFKGKKNFVVILNPHSAPFYFRPGTKTWEVCDEYTEGLLENLLQKVDSKKHHVHIFYSRAVEFSEEKPSYRERYPDLVSEYTMREFAEPLSLRDDYSLNKAAAALEKIYLSPSLKKLYQYEGTLMSLVGLKPLIQGFFNSEKVYFRNKRMWDSIFDHVNPDLVIGGRLEAMAYIVESAKERGARTLGVKLGIAEELIPSLLKFDNQGRVNNTGNSDISVLWGEKELEFVSKTLPGTEPCLKVIGRPRLDTFVNDSAYTNREECREKLGFQKDNFVVLFGATLTSRYAEFQIKKGGATFLGPMYYKWALKRFDKLCTENEHLRILIKPWGGDNIEYIQDCLDQLENKENFLLSTNKDTGFHNIQYVKAADLIVSNVSCLFGESVAAGTPVVNLALDPIKYLYGSQRIESYGLISKTVSNIDEMEETLKLLLTDPSAHKSLLLEAKKNLPLIFGKMDGQIGSRIIDEAFRLLEHKQTNAKPYTETPVSPEL